MNAPAVTRSRDGFGAAGTLELPVDRGDLRLHGVAGDVQLLGDLAEREVGGQQLEDPHLRPGQRHRARAPDVSVVAGEAGHDPAQALSKRSLGQQCGQLPSGLLRPEARGGDVTQLEKDLGERDRHLRRQPRDRGR